jgi:filamentous hemagglutinin family protein
MMTQRCQGYFLAVLFAALLNAACVLLSAGYAQTTNITSSGLGTTINGSTSCLSGTCTITGGDRRGQNLFHSFGRFDIGQGSTANFSNDTGLATSNIIGRVTEGRTSSIFGTIQTATNFGTANLFLLNPAGILFGSTARLNVGGSFHATTADYIKLGPDGVVYADPTKGSALNSAPPSAFGFLTANPRPINVQAGTLTGSTFTVLQAPPGNNTLSFVGGPVNVGPPATPQRGGFVRAPGGRVNLVSVASAGEAAFDGSGFNVDSFQQLGQINITGGSIVDAKNVFIRGGDLAITSAAIFPGFFNVLAPTATSNGTQAPPVGGGEVNIRVANGVSIGGPFNLVAPGIQFQGPLGTADVPNITVQAGSFRLLGEPATIQARQPRIQTLRNGPGKSPLVTITADTVEVRNGAFILVGNFFANSQAEGAGEIVVNARDVTLSSDGNGSFTGLGAQGTFRTGVAAPFSDLRLTTPDSGSITIIATGKLTMLERAQVTTDSLAFGKSGNVTINARDVLLIGAGANTGAIAAQSILAGASGNVTINATGAIDVQNGFRVSTNTGGSGDAGVVSLTGASITVTGADTRIQSAAAQPPDSDSNLRTFARLFNNFFTNDPRFRTPIPNSDAAYPTLRALLGVKPRPGDLMDVLKQLNALGLTNVADLTPGDGGKVSVINTPLLILDAGARIETSTLWDGNAGAIEGDVGSLSIKGGASIRSRSGADRSDGVFIGTGSAGNVTFTAADSISISDAGSTISTTTFGNGNGGSIFLTGGKLVSIQNGGNVSADSGGILAGQQFSGSGLAGNITIAAGDQIQMNSGSVSTRAVTSDGGNIALNAPRMIQLTDSQVTTSVESGFGGGGNISIDPQALILNNSRILANAFGGPGGNINIIADVFLVNNNGGFPTSLTGIVDASSALSTPGTVNIEATFTNVVGTFTQLPSTPLQASELLRASCAARFSGGKASSLVVGGRDGLPLQPGDLLPSPLYLVREADTPSTGNKVTGKELPTRFSLLGPRDRSLNQYSLLPNMKCSL